MFDKYGVEIPDNKERGLYGKYIIERSDGQPIPDDLFMFVLKGTDPHAIPALKAYIESCKADYPFLAEDLQKVVNYYSKLLDTMGQIDQLTNK